MSYGEALLVCALFDDKQRAERALAHLAECGIEGGELQKPGARLHGISPDAWELHVPQGQASRARVLLSDAAAAGKLD